MAQVADRDGQLQQLLGADARGRTVLHAAAANGRSDVVKLLIAFGADVNAFTEGQCGSNGPTALHLAARCGSAAACKALLAAGADADASRCCGSSASMTPFKEAARHGRASVVHVLLAAGVSVERARQKDSGPGLRQTLKSARNPTLLRPL